MSPEELKLELQRQIAEEQRLIALEEQQRILLFGEDDGLSALEEGKRKI